MASHSKRFQDLDISSSNISGTIPHWFWNLPSTLTRLNISHNQITGQIPHIQLEFYEHPMVDLNSNMFQGSIPSFFSISEVLILSGNQFTNSNSLLCTEKAKDLNFLDLSNNKLFELPDCFMNSKSLKILNLADNNLSGKIPKSIGSLVQMGALRHLRNNSLTGELPPSLSNGKQLKVLDVAHNNIWTNTTMDWGQTTNVAGPHFEIQSILWDTAGEYMPAFSNSNPRPFFE